MVAKAVLSTNVAHLTSVQWFFLTILCAVLLFFSFIIIGLLRSVYSDVKYKMAEKKKEVEREIRFLDKVLFFYSRWARTPFVGTGIIVGEGDTYLVFRVVDGKIEIKSTLNHDWDEYRIRHLSQKMRKGYFEKAIAYSVINEAIHNQGDFVSDPKFKEYRLRYRD